MAMNVGKLIAAALNEGNGLLRLAPTWVPRSFLQPGKRLKLRPKCTIKDGAASGWITTQGSGRMGNRTLRSPAMIKFGDMTQDEVFISQSAAAEGVEIENTGTEPLVGLRYFGPDAFPDSIYPSVGDRKKYAVATAAAGKKKKK